MHFFSIEKDLVEVRVSVSEICVPDRKSFCANHGRMLLNPLSSVYLSVNYLQCSICLRNFRLPQSTENLDGVIKLLPIKTGNLLFAQIMLSCILFFS